MYMVVDQNEKIHTLLCSSVECTVMTLQIILHKFVSVNPLFPIEHYQLFIAKLTARKCLMYSDL